MAQRKKWSEIDRRYIIDQWNEIENTGLRNKRAICEEIHRRFKRYPSKESERTVDQIRRQIETILSDQDPRIPTWPHWVRDNGSVRSDKSDSKSTPPKTSRTERNKRTYSDLDEGDDAFVNDDNDVDYELKTPKTKKTKRTTPNTPTTTKHQPPTPITEGDDDEVQELIHSPSKQPATPPLLAPRSLFDSLTGSYWTIVRVPQGLKPVLDSSHPKHLVLKLINCPPTNEELQNFPEGAKKCISAFSNQSILQISHQLSVKIEPPSDLEWERNVSVVKERGTTHHVVVEWKIKKEEITDL